MIPVEVLEDFGAKRVEYPKGEVIFSEGENANNYYQVISGEVKMNNFNYDGKEFVQGMFFSGQSFGEPPLLANVKYPANAEAITDAVLLKLHKLKFLDLLSSHPKIHLGLTKTLASRLYYKAIIASELSTQEPEHRILRLLDYLKKHVHKLQEPFSYKVDLTRQQIADLTGLRVETVIRATKSLEKKGELQIKSRKVFR
ncbi:MAG: Crp/Fnr family transcriptional regulator [Salegentibacter sp.]|uniref:cAMP-binding domain of CRP or a regulatory subunit of cAMP-dependent protein kinases n=1 Tax=Salegentibacter flavus TaxID=287099 RepID=A0A1I5AEC0_9FLAO|nr:MULTISPECIES: Crp/Fnr family transcriptional regulator [Salegentibacter]MDR9457134.1 Crp/Fnr family transcriptional regulator [Salegentibacter sp.]SFN60777.1 cAMP-binding domain of CRP or a regulatory subunit of cAMP-dependent protein kinases [Salegentibacter flavus]